VIDKLKEWNKRSLMEWKIFHLLGIREEYLNNILHQFETTEKNVTKL